MIFITLGTQKFSFERLLKFVDICIDKNIINEKVVAQIGHTNYESKNINCIRFMDRELFLEYSNEANLIITHGGTGAIISALKSGNPVIAVARESRFKEHVDDHQKQIVEKFTELAYVSTINLDESDDYIIQLLKRIKNTNYNGYVSNSKKYVDFLNNYIMNGEN